MKNKTDTMMKRDEGLFVCVLDNLNTSTNNYIGIDCKSRLIYYTVDLKAKNLTKENIEYSAGVYDNDVSDDFAGFTDVAEIVKKQDK